MSRLEEFCLLSSVIHLVSIAHPLNTQRCARYAVYSGGQKRLIFAAHFLSWGCTSACVIGGTETLGEWPEEAGGAEKTWQENRGSGAWDLWKNSPAGKGDVLGPQNMLPLLRVNPVFQGREGQGKDWGV